MQRTRQNNNPSLILCSDFHLREDTPTCWTGDFQKEQWDSIDFIYDLQTKHQCSVVHAGDLFHHWKPSPWLLSMAIQHLPKRFFTVFGQHDLPQHNLELVEKCGVQTLHLAQSLTLLPSCHFGQEPEGYLPWFNKKILVWHHMTYILPPFPGATEGQAQSVLRKYSKFDLIVTGDNHQSFYTEYKGQILINPGSLTRQTADQMDFQPRVALWYADTNTIEWVNIPIAKDVISREHIEHKEQRDARIDAFVSKLDGDWEVSMSFEQNLEEFLNKNNNVRDSVKEIIYKSIE
jgi:DNA repair exonuclease SbcCD nuclease subunit